MGGDCDWLSSSDWATEAHIRREAERALYQARQIRLEREQNEREDEYQARVYDAEQAVEYAVSVLGAARVVELVNGPEAAETTSPTEEPF